MNFFKKFLAGINSILDAIWHPKAKPLVTPPPVPRVTDIIPTLQPPRPAPVKPKVRRIVIDSIDDLYDYEDYPDYEEFEFHGTGDTGKGRKR